MNNITDTQNSESDPSSDRPFGYWLRAVDRLMAAEFAAAFESEHATRRDWRILNAVDGSATPRRPLTAHRLRALVERGWIVADGDTWTLTDEGRAAKDRLGSIVDGIRAKVADAVSPDDLATTVASLEQIARAFGWDENTPLPRGHKHGRRHERRHGRGFGRRHGFGARHGFGRPGGHGSPDAEHGDHDCGHRGHPGHGGHPGHAGHPGHPHEDHDRHEHGFGGRGHHGHHGRPGHPAARAARMAQRAFERGFDAGYSRGHDA